jgi:hypothetical protein
MSEQEEIVKLWQQVRLLREEIKDLKMTLIAYIDNRIKGSDSSIS